MKELYTKPQVNMEMFDTVDVLTTSGVGGNDDDSRNPIELPDL